MQTMRLIVTIMAGICLLAACSEKKEEPKVTAEQVRQEAQEAAKTAAAYTSEQMTEMKQNLEARLQEVDRKLAELQAQVEPVAAEAKADLIKKIEAVREQREIAAAKLEELKMASAEAWEDMKKGAEAAMDQLEQSFDQAAAHFRTEEKK